MLAWAYAIQFPLLMNTISFHWLILFHLTLFRYGTILSHT